MTIKIQAEYIEMVDINTLLPHPKNNNKHPKEQIDRLVKLIEYQGFRNPVIVQKGTNLVVAGHGRIEAAKKLGINLIPVSYQEFESDAQIYSYLTSDNAIAAWAELDLSAVNTEMLDLGPDFDIDLLGIKDFSIEPIEKFEPQSEEDAVPEVNHPITRRGDIWLLGNHRLMCGDSIMIDDVEKLMNGEKADAIWTDPPYNVSYKGKTKDSLEIKNDSMDSEDFYDFLFSCFSNCLAISRGGSAIYVSYPDRESLNFHKAYTDSGWKLSSVLVWVKNSLVMGRSDYHSRHEPIIYGWNQSSSHNWYSDRKQDSVIEINRPSKNGEHPTMKPIELIEYCLKNSSKQKDIVCDLFGGSGSTLIACEKINRFSRLMELDEKYCDVIINRWQNFTGGKATLESTGQTYEELKAERDGQAT